METPAIVRIAGLSNSNGNPIEKRWDAELPKIAKRVIVEKEVFRGIYGVWGWFL